nr:hypothetical protein [Tanacetum cinerariifolium]
MRPAGGGEATGSAAGSWRPVMVVRQGGEGVAAGGLGSRAGDESGGAGRRGGGGDEGGGRPAHSRAADGGGAEARPWWAGRDAPLVPAPWARPAGRRGRRVVRRPRADKGVARLERVRCRGARGGGRRVRVMGWGGRAGDEAGGGADS